MAINGEGIRDTSRIPRISKTTIINTLQSKEEGLLQVTPNIHTMELETGAEIHAGFVCNESELDEQLSFVREKPNQLWL